MAINNLIIFVKDLNNNLVKDAKVSLVSEKLSGITDNNGQVSFPLPNAQKININVEFDGKNYLTTFYPSGNSDQKLEINFAFNKKVQESQTSQTSQPSQQPSPSLLVNNKFQNSTYIFAILLIILIIIFVFWSKFKKRSS